MKRDFNHHAVFDLEIIKAIPPKLNTDRIEGVQYCAGWFDFENMGISTMSLAIEDERQCWEFEKVGRGFIEATITTLRTCGYKIGGFNSRKFDDQLLTANGIKFQSDFDIFEMVLEAAGLKGVPYWELKPKRSYTLDSITAANGLEKIGHGAMAPVWWQQGDKDRVIEYCRNDADIEMAVLQKLLTGDLIDPNTGRKLKYEGSL